MPITISTWWWHPQNKVERLPIPQDYRVFPFVCCSAKTIFFVDTILGIASALLLLIGLIIESSSGYTKDQHQWGYLCILVVSLVMSVLVIATKKPIYAQMLIPLTMTGIAYQCAALLVRAVHSTNARDSLSVTLAEERLNAQVEFLGSLLGLLFYVPIGNWVLYLMFNYYAYVRDVQLYKEFKENKEGQLATVNVVEVEETDEDQQNRTEENGPTNE
ncbi:unnamed protein product, partial [Mesorhabditis belari]|uniref:Uncharacterized protein n=1 Tax=Mesorhabditis belari TaxID=2138241 RepID=A0AAF3EUW7_9BILA